METVGNQEMKQKAIRFLAGLIIVFTLALVVLVIRLYLSCEVSMLASIQALAPVAILMSAFIALSLYIENVKKNQDDKARQNSASYLNEAKQMLERSYNVFVKDGDKPPSNENRAWRTAALLLLKSQEIEPMITESAHKKAYGGYKQYYALQFHKVLWSNVKAMDLDYFMPSGDPNDTNTISRKAIAVIFSFAHTIKNDYKILDDIDSASIFASDLVPSEFLGVENLLGQFQELFERVNQLKKNQAVNSLP